MKILQDVVIATGQTLWHVARRIGKAVDDHGQKYYYGDLFLMQDDYQQEVNDDNITEPSSPMDTGGFDDDSRFNLDENPENYSFFFTEYLLNPLIGLTIQYGGFDANDTQDDIVYYG